MQQPLSNPSVPLEVRIEDGFKPGKMVRIQGTTSASAERFNINLQCGTSSDPDVALHISVRLLQDYIARNSYQDGSWLTEEDSGGLPIAPGQSFEVLVLCDPAHFKVAVNGKHFCEYDHKIPYQRVTHLTIDGDVELNTVAFEGGSPQMESAPNYSAGPPPQSYGPPQQNYGPPQQNYGPPQGPYGPPQSGGPRGPGEAPWQPQEEKSGLESFLETAGSAVASALTQRMTEQMISNITGGQRHQYPNYPQYNQQQQYNQQFPPNSAGQSDSGGIDVGSLLQNLAGSVLHSQQNRPPPHQQPPAGGQGDGGVLGTVGSLLSNVAGQALSGPKQQPHYQPQAPAPQSQGGVDVGSLLSSLAEQVLTPKQKLPPFGQTAMPMPGSSFYPNLPTPSAPPLPSGPTPPNNHTTYPQPPNSHTPYPQPPNNHTTYPIPPLPNQPQPPFYRPPPPAAVYRPSPAGYPSPGYPPGPNYPSSHYHPSPSYPRPPAYPSYPYPGGYQHPPYQGNRYNAPNYPGANPQYPLLIPPQNQKKSKLDKVMKYGLPIAGAGLGAFMLSEALHGNSSSDSD